MQVTSDTLFHFTNSLKNLKNILDTNFKLTYCHEEYSLTYQKHDSYYPMVSFCDIPLSLARDQIKKYGYYAIGMKKSWAIKNNLNPIVYIEKDSFLAKDIQGTIDKMSEWVALNNNNIEAIARNVKSVTKGEIEKTLKLINSGNLESLSSSTSPILILLDKLERESTLIDEHKRIINKFSELVNSSTNLFRYIKNYSGELKRKNKIKENYRFYDEREWRYIPELSDTRVRQSLNASQYKEYRQDTKCKPFIEGISLSFKSEDVKYLLIKSNREIPNLIKAIKTIYSGRDNESTDILTTKIITFDQIKSDF